MIWTLPPIHLSYIFVKWTHQKKVRDNTFTNNLSPKKNKLMFIGSKVYSEKLIDFLHLQINHFMNILKYLPILNNLLLQLTKEIISWFGVNIRSITFWIFFR